MTLIERHDQTQRMLYNLTKNYPFYPVLFQFDAGLQWNWEDLCWKNLIKWSIFFSIFVVWGYMWVIGDDNMAARTQWEWAMISTSNESVLSQCIRVEGSFFGFPEPTNSEQFFVILAEKRINLELKFQTCQYIDVRSLYAHK